MGNIAAHYIMGWIPKVLPQGKTKICCVPASAHFPFIYSSQEPPEEKENDRDSNATETVKVGGRWRGSSKLQQENWPNFAFVHKSALDSPTMYYVGYSVFHYLNILLLGLFYFNIMPVSYLLIFYALTRVESAIFSTATPTTCIFL